ncbi:heavy-metal-associated domain-containing protein [uncultured Algibacter sp.]|uniref:heavy-metal-associated domain-containing protein n=1 Tax=uncultured Algibacter sp. TaxID=298659 RepID=UPI00260889F5|nr:heavy-metal-associated domain-containing protein [uncultured Algibacter sp.]
MQTSLKIQNLKCGGCSNTIMKKLSDIKDLNELEVSLDNDTVSFYYENEKTLAEVKELLNSIGYPIAGDKNALTTKAKSFVSCAIGRLNN